MAFIPPADEDRLKPVAIGPVIYSLQTVENLHVHDPNDKKVSLFGDVDYKTLLMRIESDLTPSQQLATIIHESIHVILEQAGREIEENAIVTLGYGIANLLINNPWLMDFI